MTTTDKKYSESPGLGFRKKTKSRYGNQTANTILIIET